MAKCNEVKAQSDFEFIQVLLQVLWTVSKNLCSIFGRNHKKRTRTWFIKCNLCAHFMTEIGICVLGTYLINICALNLRRKCDLKFSRHFITYCLWFCVYTQIGRPLGVSIPRHMDFFNSRLFPISASFKLEKASIQLSLKKRLFRFSNGG